MKYRKKPVVIEAYQTDKEMDIETLEGTMHASVGDYIITGVRGEQYPCKPDIFEQTYEPADAPAASQWHRLEEELPTEKGPYITAYYDGYVGENEWHFIGIGETAVGWLYDADAVRYWMPMPTPPKEDA